MEEDNTGSVASSDDYNIIWKDARVVLEQVCTNNGPLKLVKDDSFKNDANSDQVMDWTPFLEDPAKRSFSYYLPGDKNQAMFSEEILNKWFTELHPQGELSHCHNNGGWTDAFYMGEKLLRKTAWFPFKKNCNCEYGYSDTWQVPVTDSKMKGIITEITDAVQKCCGVTFNSVNLNYYPRGGGVGFHADDEFLFDGLHRDCLIVSLSLCNSTSEGGRKFQVRLKKNFQDGIRDGSKVHEIVLGHGDLMTMEGLFQVFYLHSVWPGDDKSQLSHELCQGERINLTWRTIVQHMDGSEVCRFKKCSLYEKEMK